LKKSLKAQEAALQAKTKKSIEALSDEVATRLLEEKWISPLVASLHKLPEALIAGLAVKVAALAQKYESTYKDLIDEMRETEECLSGLIDELKGDDYDIKGLAELKQLIKG
jgi:type I restriction enzyme M protein